MRFTRKVKEALSINDQTDPQDASQCESSPRRRFLHTTVAGATLGLVSNLGLSAISSRTAFAQSTITPDGALEELKAGNQRFLSRKLTAHEHDLDILKEKTIDKQEPFAAVLSCADSRVPVELIFDQSIGHIFVTRVAGNVITPEIIASLEYGAAVLGTEVIVVMGHASCGAVKASMQGKEVPGQISALFPHIQPAVNQAGSSLEECTKANAKIQATLLSESSTVISGLLKQGKVKVVAAYYDFATGKVDFLS
jgi:carbonic anhydrase